MIRIRLTVATESVVQRLQGVRTLPVEDALYSGAAMAQAGIEQNFTDQRSGAGRWPRLAPFTLMIREEKGYPYPEYPMLVNTGAYKQSWVGDEAVTVTDTTATIRSRDYRVSSLSEKRPVLPLQDDAQRLVLDTVLRVLREPFEQSQG